MDSSILRDEAAKERIRLAEEFLDPRKLPAFALPYLFCAANKTDRTGMNPSSSL